MADLTLEQLTSQAKSLQAEIEQKGVNAANPKDIVSKAKALLGLLDQVQPHLNKAQNAFGGQETLIQQANDLRNKLNRVIASYSTS